MKAVKCPICEGSGRLPNGEPCHGCSALGWVSIPETDECPVIYGWPKTESVALPEDSETQGEDKPEEETKDFEQKEE